MKKEIQALLCTSFALASCGTGNKPLPNIIFILADDLGYGDPGCYGQEKFKTPNIDRLSQEGMLFTQHYTGCSVSAPSRSTLMTGLHTGHTPIRGNKEVQPEGQWPLPSESFTVAEMLREQGYTTGAFGKWGLGFIGTEGEPNNQGFDEFFGYNCQRMAHNYYPGHLWHNREKLILHGNDSTSKGEYAPDLIHLEALKFIEKNRNHPFFLFYPTIIPHAELFAKKEYMERFRGRFEPEKSFSGTDSGQYFRRGGYGSQPESHAAFAALVTQLDDYVGEIVAKLEELDIEENTLVIFASDNGPHQEGGADPDFFNSNGNLRGYKRDLYEGGIRTALIVKWPGIVRPGKKSDHVSAFWDFMPTLAEITGAKIPGSTDGISFLPELRGRKNQAKHKYLYWEFHESGGRMAVRMDKWKAVKYNLNASPQGTTELYDLSTDEGETTDVAASNPVIVKEMEAIMKQAHSASGIFPFAGEK